MVGTAWLGTASGLFSPGGRSDGVLAIAPIWCCTAGVVAPPTPGAGHRVRPRGPGDGYGLFFFFNGWYWRSRHQTVAGLDGSVVIVPQWAVIGLAVVVLMACRLWSTRRRGTAALGAATDRADTG